MSTDMQRYSIENQSEAIALYAARRGLTVVRSYEDAGKSGLRLDGRHALRGLIDDVTCGRADFKTILVYDVSRWGRFQDSDESAHYEFICRNAGVAVEYCAEQFENDGSLTATVIKNIKRAMAGEYSRELSVKVFAGQSRIAANGFRRGSAAGYGLRRALVDEHGNHKTVLADRQWKSIATDRVILVPGPPHEVETVNFIYRMYADEGKNLREIARHLNAAGVTNALGRRWLPEAVRGILSNEKYIGNNIFNRTSIKLRGKWRRNPRSQWIRAKGAFEAIVSRDLFDRAQRRLNENLSYTANELLDILTAVWCQKGAPSVAALAESKCAPTAGAYQRCFGGLMNAYVLIGYARPRLKSWAKNQKFRTAMNDEIIDNVQRRGGSARLLPGGYMLWINDELSISTSVVRMVTTKNNYKRWIFGYKTRKRPDILVVARVAEEQECLRDYFFLPYVLMGRNWLTFSDGDAARSKPFQIKSLAPLFELFARESIQPTTSERSKSRQAPRWKGVAIRHGVIWPSAAVEVSTSSVINSLQNILADANFIDLISSEGLQSMPRLLSTPQVQQQEKPYGQSVLEFAVVWAFVSRLVANPAIASRLQCDWPEFTTEMKMAYLSVLTKGPFARCPSLKDFAV